MVTWLLVDWLLVITGGDYVSMRGLGLTYLRNQEGYQIDNEKLSDNKFAAIMFEVLKSSLATKECSIVTVDYHIDSLGLEWPNGFEAKVRGRRFWINNFESLSVEQLQMLLLEDNDFWVGRVWLCGKKLHDTKEADFVIQGLINNRITIVEAIRCFDKVTIHWYNPTIAFEELYNKLTLLELG